MLTRPRARDASAPRARSTPLGTANPSVLGELVRLSLRRLLAGVWSKVDVWSDTEWHDLFGAECRLRRPVSSLFRAFAMVFALSRVYYRRR